VASLFPDVKGGVPSYAMDLTPKALIGESVAPESRKELEGVGWVELG